MKTAANKSSYDKLFLIQPDVYKKYLPKLNEVEKQELNDVNEKNRHFQEDDETLEEKNGEQKNDGDEELNDDAERINEDAEEMNDNAEEMNDDVEETNDDVIIDPPPEPEISVNPPNSSKTGPTQVNLKNVY